MVMVYGITSPALAWHRAIQLISTHSGHPPYCLPAPEEDDKAGKLGKRKTISELLSE